MSCGARTAGTGHARRVTDSVRFKFFQGFPHWVYDPVKQHAKGMRLRDSNLVCKPQPSSRRLRFTVTSECRLGRARQTIPAPAPSSSLLYHHRPPPAHPGTGHRAGAPQTFVEINLYLQVQSHSGASAVCRQSSSKTQAGVSLEVGRLTCRVLTTSTFLSKSFKFHVLLYDLWLLEFSDFTVQSTRTIYYIAHGRTFQDGKEELLIITLGQQA